MSLPSEDKFNVKGKSQADLGHLALSADHYVFGKPFLSVDRHRCCPGWHDALFSEAGQGLFSWSLRSGKVDT